MREAQPIESSLRPTSRPPRHRRVLRRAMAAGAVVIGTLALAAPSWAGPLNGCC